MSNATAGYVSEEARRRFSIIAGIVCLLGFGAQFVVPFVVMMAVMPAVMFSSMKEIDLSRVALFERRIHYLTGSGPVPPPFGGKEPLFEVMSLDPATDEEPQLVAEFRRHRPSLLASGNRLWFVTEQSSGILEQGAIKVSGKGWGEGVPPLFDVDGWPAALDLSDPRVAMIRILQGEQWIEAISAPFDPPLQQLPERAAAVYAQGKFLLLIQVGGWVHHAELGSGEPLAAPETWPAAPGAVSGWQAAVLHDAPALVRYCDYCEHDSRLSVQALKPEGWRTLFSTSQRWSRKAGILPVGTGESFYLLLADMPGSLRVWRVENGKIIARTVHGQPFPFGKPFMAMMSLPYLAMMIVPLLMALVLSTQMRIYRQVRYAASPSASPAAGGPDSVWTAPSALRETAEFASLTRRALAQIADVVIAAGPLACSYFLGFQEMFRGDPPSEPGLPAVIGMLASMAGGIAWIVVLFFVFSYAEGRWGITPGKWMAGIRVTGVDLRPCGFGRALLRNLLKPVDGFFNFMVGIMVAALTENWQRVGDMVARTVVIRAQSVRKAEVLLDPARSAGGGEQPPPLPPAHQAPPVALPQSSAVEAVVPYRNSSALTAYYFGVFALVPCFTPLLGPAAVLLGVLGLKKAARSPAVRGRAHAWIGIALGLLTIVVYTGIAVVIYLYKP